MPKVSTNLTDKQLKFVHEYCSDMDRIRALREAGYTGTNKALGVRAAKLLKDPKIQKAIAEVGQPILERANLATERILHQLENFLFMDPADLFDEQGYLQCDLKELPPAVRQCIVSFEVDEQYDKETGELLSKRIKVKTADKVKALEMAMKYKKLFEEKKETNVNINFWDKLYESPEPQVSQLHQRMAEIENAQIIDAEE